MKSIVQPDDQSRLGLTGWYNADGTPIQKGNISAHDTTQHSEYAAGVRLVADKVTVTLPDGTVINDTMENIMKDPKYFSSINHSKGIKTYKTDKSKEPPKSAVDKVKEDLKIDTLKPVEKPTAGTSGVLDKVYTYFKDLSNKLPSF
jgi:hypothetical protein